MKKETAATLAGKALLVGASTVAALLLAEAAVRILDLPPRPLAPLPLSGYQLSANPVIGYEYRPNHAFVEDPYDNSEAGIVTNSEGFRDIERSVEKPAGVCRIVAIGDSTTAGSDVPNRSALFTARLEELLNRDAGGSEPRYEVLNLAVGGYHTLQEVETLRTKGLKYRPDLVLLTICINDFDPGSEGGIQERLRRINRLSARGEGTARSYQSLLRLSRLAFVLHHRLHSSLSEQQQWYATHVLRGKSTVRAGLALLSELQEERGFASLVVILPGFYSDFHVYEWHEVHRRVFEDAAGLPGIRVVDLLQPFAAVSNDASRFSNDAIHLSESGHAVMAGILLPLVREALPDPP